MPERTLKYLIIGLLLLAGPEAFSSSIKKLSEQAQISILIGDPTDTNFYSLFGHAGLRIKDPGLEVDYVFNYAIESSPTKLAGFIRLYRKNIPSELYAVPFVEIVKEYQLDRRALNELVLNFSQEEKELLWQSMMMIAQARNRISYYDIFNHNCTALPLALIEESTAGKICFSQQDSDGSYRSYFNPNLIHYPWSSFVVNISLGQAIDRPLSYRESFFFPRNFEEGLLSASVTDYAGNIRPLITHTEVIVPRTEKITATPFFTPALCAWLLLIIVIVLCFFEWKNKRLMRRIDIVLFTIAGIVGLYLFCIQFVIAKWCFFPSWWILWLHPLHFLGAVWSSAKRFDRLAVYYHIFNLCALGIMLIGTCFVYQYFDPAFAPLMMVLALRSGIRVFNYYNIHF